MNYSEELFWRRVMNLYRAWQNAEHPDFKRIWMDKLQLLMQGVDKSSLNWYNTFMNIFYLHNDPKICAEQHVDKHVVKMIVEYAQLLSTAHRMLDGEEYIGKSKTGRNVKRYRMTNPNLDKTVYQAVHYHHPSAVWARETKAQYEWLYSLFVELGKEYTYR